MDRKTARELVERLNRDGAHVARRYGLRYRAIQAERAGVNGHYGVCYSDGVIKIRLRHAVTGRPLKYSSLVNTLCHELAHLRFFDHGERFQLFYRQLLEYARAEGIYRPRAPGSAPARPARTAASPGPSPGSPVGPVQLALF